MPILIPHPDTPWPGNKKISVAVHFHPVGHAFAFSAGFLGKDPTVLQSAIGRKIIDPDVPLLAVIDVEGTEVAVLDGFDVARWKPRMMLLEDNVPGGDPKLTQALSKKPYVQVGWIECNRIYVRNDCIDIRDRLLEINLYV